MNKKILLVYDVSYPHVEGGGQRRMFEVARRLVDDGHQVTWICFRTWSEDSNEFKFEGIRYIGLEGFRGLYRDNGSRRRLEPIEFVIALYKSNINLKDYDVIWSGQWPILHLIWWLFNPRYLSGIRLVVDWWEVWGITWFQYAKIIGLIGYFIEKLLIKIISQRGSLILISPASYYLVKSMVPSGNVYLINNGIDASKITTSNPDSDQVSDISYVGRLKDHKRLDLLIDAIGILKISKNLLVSVAIIGDGPEMSNLKQQSIKLNVQDQIKFYGSIPSNETVYGILKSSKIFVNPSTKEGGGSITLFEAFASGLPVVAFKCKDGIDPELIGDGVCGLLREPICAESLADGIYSLLSNPDLLMRLSKRSYEESKKYDWHTIANEYKKVFASDADLLKK